MGVAEAMRQERWTVIDEDGNELGEGEMPSLRALRMGKIESNKVLGFYNPALRKLTWFAVTSVPQFAPGSDRPHQVLSLFTDVTRLKRDSALFERVQEIAHIGAWEWDAGRDALYVSDEARRMLGLTDPPGCMADAQGVFLPGDRKRLQAALERLVRDEGAFDLELQGVREDEPFWVRVIGQSEPGNPLARHFTGTIQDVTERKHAEEALRVQARTDPLTGMLDRDAILGEIGDWLDDPALSRFAVLYIDLDRFKVVNDVLGHAAGDELLVAVAQRIEAAVGADGLVARFGGDEFLVICGAADDPGRPQRIAEAILHGIGDGFRIDNEDFAVTASIGIAHSPQDGGSVQVLLQNADAAMYDSKRRIRNGWLAYNPALAESRKERLRVETHLRRAADSDEFHLVYQPQVELQSGRIVGAEALIRWENPQLGPMPPDRFIAHAEITGDIVRIGAWVMREACRQA